MEPLREPTYYILASLIDQPRHGWGIIQEVAEMSQKSVRLTAGTLYGALDRLETEGLVEKDHEEVVNGRCRRYHRLTARGEGALREEVERLSASVQVVKQRLATTAPRKLRELGGTA